MPERAVEVWCRGGYGSGYLVGYRRVLTALHVVADGVRGPEEIFERPAGRIGVREQLKIRLSGENQWWPCRLIWPAPDGLAQHDLALLELLGDGAPEVAPVRWGRLTTSTPKITCEFMGFPRAQHYATPDPAIVVSAGEHMTGAMNLRTGLKAGYLFVYPDHTLGGDSSAWRGFSGAGVLCNDLLTAILVGARMDQGRLFTVPIAPILSDSDFRAALGWENDVVPRVESVELAPFTTPDQGGRQFFRASPAASFASLLRADEETVRFHGRDDELRQLITWSGGTGFSMQLLTGLGGMGKTRLAREFMSRLCRAEPNWTCSFFGRVDDVDVISAHISRLCMPTLLIVDYAETLSRTTSRGTGQIEKIIMAGTSRHTDTPLRMLLIARSAGDWWQQVISCVPGLSASPDTTQIIGLYSLDDSAESRRELYMQAWLDLRTAISGMLPLWRSPSPETIMYPDLKLRRYGSPLAMQMEALASLLEPGLIPGSRKPEEVILEHEQRYWESAAAAADLNIHRRTQRRAVGGASLYGADTEQEALHLITELPNMPQQYGDLHLRMALWLQDLYPPTVGWVRASGQPQVPSAFWGSLQPDLLNEHLVGTVAGENPAFVEQVVGKVSDGQIRRALTVLSRAAINQSHIGDLIRSVVAGAFRVLLQAVPVIAETEDPTPLLEGLATVELSRMPISELRELVTTIPAQTERLAHFAVEAQRELSRRLRDLAEAEPETYLGDLAQSLDAEASRLRDVGRARQALLLQEEAAGFAVRHQENGGAIPPHQSAARYVDLAVAEAEIGHADESLNYVRRALILYEQLTAEEFNNRNLGLSYARAMQVAAIESGQAGNLEAALDIFDRLVHSVRSAIEMGGERVFAELLAGTLHSQAIVFRRAGHLDEAIIAESEAVAMWRDLARDWPDAYLPMLATSLSFLGGCRAESGNQSAGAETIREALNAFLAPCLRNPTVYLPRLILCYYNFYRIDTPANIQFEATDKILRLYEELKERYPRLYLPMLANILHVGAGNKRSVIIFDHGTGRASSLDQADEAVSIYRRLYNYGDKGVYGPLLASSLMDLADFLDTGGRYENALEASQEALGLLAREIPMDDPFGQRGVIDALVKRADRLTKLGRNLEALPFVREIHKRALASGDLTLAARAAFPLVKCCRRSGQLEEAVEVGTALIDYIEQAGLGPWTSLAAKAEHLLVLSLQGHPEHAFAEVRRLRAGMDLIPAESEQPEIQEPGNVREVLLNVGTFAAGKLARFEEALDFAVGLVESMRARGATEAEIAQAQTNVYSTMIELGRVDEALQLLDECRGPLEEADDADALSNLLAGLARAQSRRGDGAAAITTSSDVLRYAYRSGDMSAIAAAHAWLGRYLAMHDGSRQSAMTHLLAAGLICIIADLDDDQNALKLAGSVLAVSVATTVIPRDVDELCRRAGELPGVELERVLTRLAGDRAAVDSQLTRLVARVRALTAKPSTYARWLASWDPVIAGIIAERRGQAEASNMLDRVLGRYLNTQDWAALAGVLGEIRNGKSEVNIADLDETDRIILQRVSAVFSGKAKLPAALWPAMGYAEWLGDIVAAARGDSNSGRSALEDVDGLATAGLTRLSSALRRILQGERGPDLTADLTNPIEQAVITIVLYHITNDAMLPPDTWCSR